MRSIDLSHTFRDKMPRYPGDTIPSLEQFETIGKETYINHHFIKTGMHVGTHIDAPLHMRAGGKKIPDFPPETFCGNGVFIDARGASSIDEVLLNGVTVHDGDIVIVMTGLYKKFGTKEYFEKYPVITESFAKKLIGIGVKMLGVDTPSPDRSPYHIHKLLFQYDILIIENLANLEELLLVKRFEIYALPVKFDAEAAPARVVALIVN